MFELRLTSVRLFVSFMAVLLSLKCKGTREYVLEPLSLPLAILRRGFENAELYGWFSSGGSNKWDILSRFFTAKFKLIYLTERLD